MLMKTKNYINLVSVFLMIILVGSIDGQESLFPKIAGWNLTVEKEVYDANNLWDIIDGAADLFLEYSFIDLHTAGYMNADSIEVKVELYRFNNSLNAFGMYSQERYPDYHFIDIGAQGYIEDGVLNFLDGVYYIKMSTYTNGKTGQDAMVLIAHKLVESLNQENSLPQVLSYFPEKSKLQNTEKYVAHNFLGYSFLNSVMTVSYKNEKEFTAFLVKMNSHSDALATVKKFLDSQAKENITQSDDNKYEVNDKMNGLMNFAVEKDCIYGLMNCADKIISKNFMQEFESKVSKM